MRCPRCNAWLGKSTLPTPPIPGVVCGRCREEDKARRHNVGTAMTICGFNLVLYVAIIFRTMTATPSPSPIEIPIEPAPVEPEVLPGPGDDGRAPSWAPKEPTHAHV